MHAYRPFWGAAVLVGSILSVTTNVAASDEWVLLKRFDSEFGKPIVQTVNEILEEELQAAGKRVLDQTKVDRMLAVLGVEEVRVEQVADIVGGIGAEHALLVVLERKEGKIVFTLHRYDDGFDKVVTVQQKTPRLAIARKLRKKVGEILKAPREPLPSPRKAAVKASKSSASERRKLGARVRMVSRADAKAVGLKEPTGALVIAVTPETAAAEAGIKPDDIILSVHGREIKNAGELSGAVAAAESTRFVSIVVWRRRKEVKLNVFLGNPEAFE